MSTFLTWIVVAFVATTLAGVPPELPDSLDTSTSHCWNFTGSEVGLDAKDQQLIIADFVRNKREAENTTVRIIPPYFIFTSNGYSTFTFPQGEVEITDGLFDHMFIESPSCIHLESGGRFSVATNYVVWKCSLE